MILLLRSCGRRASNALPMHQSTTNILYCLSTYPCEFPPDTVYAEVSSIKGKRLSTRWTSRGSLPRNSEGHLTKFAQHKDVKCIARGMMTLDERVVIHRVIMIGFGTILEPKLPGGRILRRRRQQCTTHALISRVHSLRPNNALPMHQEIGLCYRLGGE